MRSEADQLAGLDRVARLAASRQTNMQIMHVEPGHPSANPPIPAMLGLVPVGVPPSEALQVVYFIEDYGYDVWSKGGSDVAANNVTAEVAADRLVRQYLRYKVERITDRGV